MLHQALGGDRRHHLASVVRPLAPAVAQREGEGVGEVRRTKDAASQQRLDDYHRGEVQEKRHGETCFEIVVGHRRIALPDEASEDTRRRLEGRPDLVRPGGAKRPRWESLFHDDHARPGTAHTRIKRPATSLDRMVSACYRARIEPRSGQT